jgi:hypothetical protein
LLRRYSPHADCEATESIFIFLYFWYAMMLCVLLQFLSTGVAWQAQEFRRLELRYISLNVLS